MLSPREIIPAVLEVAAVVKIRPARWEKLVRAPVRTVLSVGSAITPVVSKAAAAAVIQTA